MENEDRHDFIYQPPQNQSGSGKGLSIFVTIAALILALMALDHAAYAALETLRDWFAFLN